VAQTLPALKRECAHLDLSQKKPIALNLWQPNKRLLPISTNRDIRALLLVTKAIKHGNRDLSVRCIAEQWLLYFIAANSPQ
jgi:hypothetical protein